MKTSQLLLSVILSISFSMAFLLAVQNPAPARPGGGSSFKSSRSSSSKKSSSSSRSSSSSSSRSSSSSSSSRSSSSSSVSSRSSSSSSSGSSGSSTYSGSGSGVSVEGFGALGIPLILDAVISIMAVFSGYHGILGKGALRKRPLLRIPLYSVLLLLGLSFALVIFPFLRDILFLLDLDMNTGFISPADPESFILIAAIFHFIFVGVYWVAMVQGSALLGKRVVSSSPTAHNIVVAGKKADLQLQAFKQRDPNFSRVLFLDFVSLLYHKYYSYLGTAHVKELLPFFDKTVLAQATQSQQGDIRVSEIVIGSMKMEFKESENADLIQVELDANYTVTRGDSSERRVVLERWLLARGKGLVSLEPEKMRALACPSCGAPAKMTDSGTCDYCDKPLNAGLMQWFVLRRVVVNTEAFSTEELGTYAEEQGTQLPTRYQHNLVEMSEQFAKTHKVNWPAFRDTFLAHIVKPCFQYIYDAWSLQEWQTIRHLVSDRLYTSNQFWIEAYKIRGLVNWLEKIVISNTEVVRIELDTFYESITVRIFASCLDYVEDAGGKLIGGSRRKPRAYSEYWTFIRRSGVEIDEARVNLNQCPNCGAPADKMGQSAECGYCGSKISYGDYSWVLAVIEQDDSYGT